MTQKAIKITLLISALVLVALTATAVTAKTPSKGQLPEYVGSQACLGCHADYVMKWETSKHAMSFQVLDNPGAYPADPSTVPAELKAELDKADFVWHGRFLAQDPATGEYRYLGVQYNETKKAYEPYQVNPNNAVWSADTSCGGCHSGAINAGVHKNQQQSGISCESCHGPGRDHILGKGKVSLIVSSTEASKTCAQCHSGYNQIQGAARFAKGYKPGTPIEEFAGFKMKAYSDTMTSPPAMTSRHREQYPQWKASAHASATNLLIERGPTYLSRQECIYCHSTAAGIQINDKKQKFNYATDLVNDGVSCVACHSTHAGTEFTAQLKMEPQALCVSCHSIGRGNPAPQTIGLVRAPHAPQADMLWGQAAIGVPATKGSHSGVTCLECHMTEGNHMMKVVKPADVIGSTRKDSCTACHSNSTPESRDVYLSLWKESISSRLKAIDADVTMIDARIAANKEALTGANLTAYQQARANFWYVRKDNSMGAHNFEYAIKILTKVQKDMAEIKKVLK